MLGDLNEAAGAADGLPCIGRASAIALVTEKGDLCDRTDPADARGARTPQLRTNDDSHLWRWKSSVAVPRSDSITWGRMTFGIIRSRYLKRRSLPLAR